MVVLILVSISTSFSERSLLICSAISRHMQMSNCLSCHWASSNISCTSILFEYLVQLGSISIPIASRPSSMRALTYMPGPQPTSMIFIDDVAEYE